MNVIKVSLLMVILFNRFSYAMMPDEVDPEDMKYLVQQERDKAIEEYNEMVKQKEAERIKYDKDLKQGGPEDIVKSPGTGKIDKGLIGTEKGVKKFYVKPNFYFLLLLFCAGLYMIFSRTARKIKRDEKGLVFVLVMAFMLLLVVIATGFIKLSNNEIRTTIRQGDSLKALYIAEAGFHRALYDLKQDFVTGGSSPSWSDGYINGYPYPGSPDTYNTLYSNSLGVGNYTVSLKKGTNENYEIWVKSQGIYNNVTRTVQAYVKIKNISPWNNAIFAGSGSGGGMINGHVDIRGSVHILGTGLPDGALVFDMDGSSNIGNNYNGIPASLSSRVPALPTTNFEGETISTLNAELRIRNGIAGLSGTATAGQTNIQGNAVKETLDGAYVTDGYGGNKGATNVYSDNGTTNPYDLESSLPSFPTLASAFGPGPDYAIYRDNALQLINELSNINPNSVFTYPPGGGINSISMDGSGNLTISGKVYVNGTVEMDKQGSNKTINYQGNGSILSTGNIDINVNLLAPNSANSFPTNAIGFMTPGDITFDEANIDVMGAFYAETKIKAEKQTNVAGSFLSNYYDMGTNVPSIYQVPALSTNLPTGMISPTPVWNITTTNWREVY